MSHPRGPLVILGLAAAVQASCSLVGLDGLSGGDATTSGAGGDDPASGGAGPATATTTSTTTVGTTSSTGAGGAGGGDEGGGGGCVAPSYAEVVAAAAPLVHFRFEETEGDVTVAEDGVTAGDYKQETGAPGSDAPVELGVPGLAGGGRAVQLPPIEAALVLPVDARSFIGSNFDPQPHTIELWLGVAPTFRGAVLQQVWGGASTPGTLALRVDPPIAIGPSIGFHVDPNDHADVTASASPESVARVHVAVVVTRIPGPTPCQSPEQIVVHVDGVPGEPVTACGYAAILRDGSGPMNLPGASTPMPVTPLVLDELAIYQRALTTDEIVAHAAAGRACE